MVDLLNTSARRAIAVGGVLVTGFVAGLVTPGGSHEPPTESVGNASFSLVDDLSPAAAGDTQAIASPLEFSEDRGYALRGVAEDGVVIVGIYKGEGPALLPAGVCLLRQGESQVFHAGAYLAVRTTGALPTVETRSSRCPHKGTSGSDTENAIVYSVPVLSAPGHWTNVGIICPSSSTGDTKTLEACEQLITTLHAQYYGYPLSAEKRSDYASRLRQALAGYYDGVPFWRHKLEQARYAEAEIQAALKLASLNRSAERAIAKVPPDPIAAPAQRALERALAQVARGYASLVGAAGRNNPAAWQAGRRSVGLADALVARALQELAPMSASLK